MRLKSLAKGGPLLALTATEMLAPFVRMVILTHMLGGFELGFAAALSAVYATIEQITDTGLYRFVLATPRERYKDALATAHGIAILRGIIVSAVFVGLAFPFSCYMVTCGDWPSFMWLAPLTLIKGVENLEMRVYERDYRYWPQLISSFTSHGLGLIAMFAIGLETHRHDALLGYLIVQAISFTICSHLFANSRMQFKFGGDLFGSVLRFSSPLMLNGVGNAIMVQGDRLFVGAHLGLETLGLYAVMVLTAYVPTSGLFRFLGPVIFAGLMNSRDEADLNQTRLKLYSRVVPAIAAVFALGWIALGKHFVPLIFGARFQISNVEIMLVGMILYLRICRAEPAQSLLIKAHLTHRMAVGNQIPIVGLVLGITLTGLYPSLEALLLGIAIGELCALTVMLTMGKMVWGRAFRDAVINCASYFVLCFAVGGLTVYSNDFDGFTSRLVLSLVAGLGVMIAAFITIWPLVGVSYRNSPKLTANSDQEG